MSKVEMHAPFTNYRGTIGKLVYRKYKGKTVASLKRDDDLPLKQGEKDHRFVFVQAAAWAKTAIRTEGWQGVYEDLAEQKGLTPYTAAVADFLKPPTIELLDISGYRGQIGDKIFIAAMDNGGVVSIRVRITNAQGDAIENGYAVELEAGTNVWTYQTTRETPAGTNVSISVSVFDRPGNEVIATEAKTL